MSWTAADVGKKCKTTTGKRGTVKFVGEGAFAPGQWIGVELVRNVHAVNYSVTRCLRHHRLLACACSVACGPTCNAPEVTRPC